MLVSLLSEQSVACLSIWFWKFCLEFVFFFLSEANSLTESNTEKSFTTYCYVKTDYSVLCPLV